MYKQKLFKAGFCLVITCRYIWNKEKIWMIELLTNQMPWIKYERIKILLKTSDHKHVYSYYVLLKINVQLHGLHSFGVFPVEFLVQSYSEMIFPVANLSCKMAIRYIYYLLFFPIYQRKKIFILVGWDRINTFNYCVCTLYIIKLRII